MNTRQQDILTLLEQQGEITISVLSEHFGVSPMTIHRDLDYLEENKYIYKKRGAAVFVNAPDRNTTVFYSSEKQQIGKKAAEFIKPGQSIIFDNSTTAFETARHLRGIPKLTIYTTNIEIASLVSDFPDVILYCSGGHYFSDSKGFIGSHAENFVASVKADLCIIGASGISIETGITNPYSMHTVLQRKIIESAKQRIIVADHSKFEKTAMEKAADFSEIDMIITDSGIHPDILSKYKKHIKIEIA